MTDLERAQWAICGEPETWIPMIVMHLAAARREGAEAALAELNEALSNGDPEAWRKVDMGIPKAIAAAERRGAEEMRERAAQRLIELAPVENIHQDCIDAIAALPLTPEEPA